MPYMAKIFLWNCQKVKQWWVKNQPKYEDLQTPQKSYWSNQVYQAIRRSVNRKEGLVSQWVDQCNEVLVNSDPPPRPSGQCRMSQQQLYCRESALSLITSLSLARSWPSSSCSYTHTHTKQQRLDQSVINNDVTYGGKLSVSVTETTTKVSTFPDFKTLNLICWFNTDFSSISIIWRWGQSLELVWLMRCFSVTRLQS